MALRAVVGATLLLAAAGCGNSTQLPEAPSSGGLTSGKVALSQTGNGAALVDQTTVAFSLDTSGSLVVRFNLISKAVTAQTITVRATLYDSRLSIIGDAQGGQINVPAGATVPVELNGPAPNGTIASALFEVTALSAPTPTVNGTPTPGTPAATTYPPGSTPTPT